MTSFKQCFQGQKTITDKGNLFKRVTSISRSHIMKH